jgi:hypothetical protein
VAEDLDDEVAQLRKSLRGLDVHRRPVVRALVVDEMDLVVRGIGRPLPARVHHAPDRTP